VAAAQLLVQDYGIRAEVWSATSFVELAREAREVQRLRRLQAVPVPEASHVARCLDGDLPVVAASDYVRAVPQLIAEYVAAPFTTLGTDGFGRSGTRSALRRFFEVDRFHVAVAALDALARSGAIDADLPRQALARYALENDSGAPWQR
jgi:pyruvate dehydrogenase E1 component